MKLKCIFLSLLAVLWMTACTDEDSGNPLISSQPVLNKVEFDMDHLSATYGPALTRGISSLDGVTTYALPSNVTNITMLPKYEGDHVMPSEGETKMIIAEGSFSILQMRAYDAINNETLQEVNLINTGGYAYGAIQVPAYRSTVNGAVRMIMYQYLNDNNVWEIYHYEIQNAIPTPEFEIWSELKTDIPKEGGSYMIYIKGDYPATENDFVFIRAVDSKGEAVSSTVVIAGTTQKSEILTISENTGTTSRVIRFEYRKMQDTEFTEFEMHVQDYKDSGVGGSDDYTIEHNFPDRVSADGGTYYVFLNGKASGNVLVWLYHVQGWGNVTPYITLNMANPSAAITIPANTSTTDYQTYVLRISRDNLQTEEGIWVIDQSPKEDTTPPEDDDYTIPGTNLQFAIRNLGEDYWVNLNGISNTYNNRIWTPGTNITTNSGCAGYSEKSDGSDRGSWFLPSFADMYKLLDAYLDRVAQYGFDNGAYATTDNTAIGHEAVALEPGPSIRKMPELMKESKGYNLGRCVRKK